MFSIRSAIGVDMWSSGVAEVRINSNVKGGNHPAFKSSRQGQSSNERGRFQIKQADA